MVVKAKIWVLLRSQFSCFNLCTNKADFYTEKHSLMQTELWSHPNPSIRDRKRGWHATVSLLLRKQAYVATFMVFQGPFLSH